MSTSSSTADTTKDPGKVAPTNDVSTSVNLPPDAFVPASTRANYLEMARNAAAVNGSDAKDELAKLVATFRQSHKGDPTAGWDHLANALENADPAEGAPIDPAVLARARAIESARRDPYPTMLGSADAVAAAVETYEARAAEPLAEQPAGTVPNTGPLLVDAPSSADAAAVATDPTPEPAKADEKPKDA